MEYQFDLVGKLIERDGADITAASIRLGDFVLLLWIDNDVTGSVRGLLE